MGQAMAKGRGASRARSRAQSAAALGPGLAHGSLFRCVLAPVQSNPMPCHATPAQCKHRRKPAHEVHGGLMQWEVCQYLLTLV